MKSGRNLYKDNNLTISVCYPVSYGWPINVSIVCFYLKLKQTSIIKSVNQVDSKGENNEDTTKLRIIQHGLISFQRIIKHNKEYGQFMLEVKDYNNFMSRALNILFFIFILLICYITYLVFLTSLSTELIYLFSNIYTAHVMVLCCLIMACSWISKGNGCMARATITLFNKKLSQRYKSTIELLKVCYLMFFLKEKLTKKIF